MLPSPSGQELGELPPDSTRGEGSFEAASGADSAGVSRELPMAARPADTAADRTPAKRPRSAFASPLPRKGDRSFDSPAEATCSVRGGRMTSSIEESARECQDRAWGSSAASGV